MKKIRGALLLTMAFFLGIFLTNIGPFVFAHEGGTRFLHACVKTSGLTGLGSIRMILPGGACNANETPVDWNKLGAPGLGGLISNLDDKNLDGIDLRVRNLDGNNFTNTTFNEANLTYASVKDANFTNSSFQGAQLKRIDLRETNIEGVDLTAATLDESNLENKNLSTVTINGTSFIGAIMVNVVLPSNLSADFRSANLTGVDFSNVTSPLWPTTQFQLANLTDVNLSGLDLTNLDFTGTNLTGADLSNSVRDNIIWSGTICPDGTNSNDNGGTCEGHLTL